MDKEYLIKKWLADELTSAEKEAFEQLDDYKLDKRIIESAKYFKASAIKEPASIESFYSKVNKNKSDNVSKPIQFSFLLKVAAVVTIFFGIGAMLLYTKDTSFQTLANNKINISLPDTSQVTLNSKSEIVFNKYNWSTKREVNLDGEAFFEVAKGETFDVITTGGNIRVLGTKFNVKNRENYFEVKCYEGIVSVTVNGIIKKLHIGETYRKINTKITSSNITGSKPEWINNISSFTSVPYSEVIKEFERQYEVIITLNNIDNNRLFTGGFVHDNLNNGLKTITLPLDVSYTIDAENRITLHEHTSE